MLKSEKQVIDGPLDLNRASETELASLDGIGMARARAIVAWRERHGFFEAVEDLQRVGDITPEAIRHLRPHLKIKEEDFPMGRNKGQSKPEPINQSHAGDKPQQPPAPGGAQQAPEHQKSENDAGRREFGRDG